MIHVRGAFPLLSRRERCLSKESRTQGWHDLHQTFLVCICIQTPKSALGGLLGEVPARGGVLRRVLGRVLAKVLGRVLGKVLVLLVLAPK